MLQKEILRTCHPIRKISRSPLYLIGQGFTNCNIPSFIKNHYLTNPHVYTPYTPYQAEISQGRLEMLHNYQQIVQGITNMDIAVASMIENGQVGMDLVTLMSQHTKKKVIYIQKSLNIPLLNCIRMRAMHQDIKILYFDSLSQLCIFEKHNNINNCAGIFIQTPCRKGNIVELSSLNKLKEINPKLMVACASDLMFLSGFNLPEQKHIDFVFGNGGNMGVGLNYGGPQPAFLATRKKYTRLLPGRIIGKTLDTHEKEGFRMALQTREQHIKRERATSNVCTSQALLATMSAAWCMYHGTDGLQKKAHHIYDTTKGFVEIMERKHIPILNDSFFDTISVSIQNDKELYERCMRHNIFPYISDNNTLSFTFDETHDENTLERLEYICNTSEKSLRSISKNYSPTRDTIDIEDVNMQHTEQSLMRYLHSIQMKDYSLMNGMIPLGSCTMKHTPHEPMVMLTDPKWNIHPYVPHDRTPHAPIIANLTRQLCELSGFDDVFYQSQSGAMGEYAGLSTIKQYLNDDKRTVIFMPRSAHGTNAASCVLAGYTPIYIDETENGEVDMRHLNALLDTYGSTLAGLMITYPSTYGLYEPNIETINHMIHEAGGQVYMDGANMNALIGMDVLPASLGFDVCHFNLHKTFCIPHGGGGPGMGPIAVKSHLTPYLPGFNTQSETKSISTTPYGSGSLLLIPEHYISSKTNDNWKNLHTRLIETTKYVIAQLEPHYTIMHNESKHRAHEFILDINPLKKKYKVSEVDICKRLMDYGFHGPTMSWPVQGGLMIEITETEDHAEVRRFIDALCSIRREIETSPELLHNAPHTQQDVSDWKYSYSIKDACYPSECQIDNKYWPTRNRLNDVYGDRLMMKR